MGLYRNKFNPVSGQFNLVPTGTIITFKDGVANAAALPGSGNTLNDARITNDTGHLYVWSGTTWVDQGDVINLTWSAIDGKPSSSAANIDDAVSKKHSNSLDHTQGTDQGLDTGGVNAVTAAQAKAGYSHSQVAHAPSDAVSLATVKADTDIDNAIDNSHAPHSDDQDLTDIILNIMLNAFRIAQIGSLTIFSMIKGFMDEYESESGIDLINSINQDYNAIGDFYQPLPTGIDSYVKLLLHCDGSNESQLFIDDSGNSNVVTAQGNAELLIAQKKFGTASGYFSGTTNDYLTVPNSSTDFDFGSGDFTIDLWARFTELDTPDEYHYPIFCSRWSSPASFIFGYDNKGLFDGVNNWLFFQYNSNQTHKVSWTAVVDTWYHFAVVRNGANLKLYVNGIQIGSTFNIGTTAILDNTNDLYIGNYQYLSGGDNSARVRGYIDELRISKGIARWTSNFTSPSSAYEAVIENMILKSNAQVATIVPTEARIVLFEEDVDSIVENTDLKAYVSRDNGTTYSQVTLEDEGNYISSARVLSGLINISGQPSGSNIKYKIETLNNKNLKIHGTGISWK